MKFCRHFTVEKTRLPLPAVRLSGLYIKSSVLIWMEHVESEGLWKNFSPTKCLVCCAEMKGSDPDANLVSENIFPKKIIHH